MSKSFNLWRKVPHRYDMPKTRTLDLLESIEEVRGITGDGDYSLICINILDAIRQIIPDPTVQDVKVATYLIGENYEAKDIAYICAYLRMSQDISGCNAVLLAHRDDLAKLLEKS